MRPLARGVPERVARARSGCTASWTLSRRLGLLEHGRISQPLLGAGCYADVLLVAVRAPDRSGGYVGQQLGQLHVDLVEVGRGGVEQPDTTEVLVDVAQGVPSGKVGEQHPLTATYRFQAEPSPNSMCRARRVV